jgi:hypothetical protein
MKKLWAGDVIDWLLWRIAAAEHFTNFTQFNRQHSGNMNMAKEQCLPMVVSELIKI